MTGIKRIPYKVKEEENSILNFFGSIFALKNTVRTGWVKYHGIKKEHAESVADHTFSTTVLAYLFAKEHRPDLDADKILKMTLFHEFGEALIGDISMRDFPDKEKKYLQEKDAFLKIFQNFKIKSEILDLWEEFEESKTPEAKFSMQFDKFEFLLQANIYNQEKKAEIDINSSYELTKKYFFDKEILKLIKELKKK